MTSDLFTLRASLEMSVVLLCFFSILYFLPSNRKEDRWLILIYFVHLWVVLSSMISGDAFELIPQTPFFVNPAPLLLFIPSFYFYTLDLVKPNTESWRQRWVHFIPFVVVYIAWLFFGRDNPVEKFINLNESTFLVYFTVLMVGIFLFYGYQILKLISLNEKKFKDEYAKDYWTLNLHWIKWITYLMVALPLLNSILVISDNEILNKINYITLPLTILINLGALAFFAFRQPVLYREEMLEAQLQSENMPLQNQKTDKNDNSPFWEPEQKSDYIQTIEKHFKEVKPYLNPTIRMPELARSLNIPRHIFSALINEHYQMNFFNLINQHRVEYAKTLLKDEANQSYTLETIGEMAGFNSRSTFNKCFREMAGMSPKEFQQTER